MIELKSTAICTKKCFICFNKSPSKKMMKHAFYFALKVLFLLETCKFLSWYFGHIGKTNLIRKIWLISKLMTSQPGQQTIAIHIFPNISQSKWNQTMKFGQLIEYNKRKTFFQISCKGWCRKTSPRPLFFI